MLYDGGVRVEGLLLDLDGTLHVGDGPVPGAREALGRLRGSNIALRFVTNTTRRPRRAVVDGLTGLGFEVEPDEVFTPAVAAAGLVGGGTCFALVDPSLLEDLAGVELTRDRPDHVLVGDLGEGFTYRRLDEAFRFLMEGAGLMALQKNRNWQTADGLSLDAGPFVVALEYASGKSAVVVGKPERRFFQMALRDMGLEARTVAMVGDDPEADVAGAKRTGLRAVQVRTGKWRPGGDVPGTDLRLDSIAELPDVLGV